MADLRESFKQKIEFYVQLYNFKHYLFMISISAICDWAGTNPKQRNFVEGERILKAGHIIKCGKNDNKNERENEVSFTAYCLRTSQLRETPHEINGVINKTNSKVLSVQCSCKAGLGEQCKHVIATLLYCNRNDISEAEKLSCTDKPCAWKKSFKEALVNYAPQPLLKHKCFMSEPKKQYQLQNNDVKEVYSIILSNLRSSAFTKEQLGRHKSVTKMIEPTSDLDQIDKSALEAIFNHQKSDVLTIIEKVQVNMVIEQCCLNELLKLFTSAVDLCVKTLLSYEDWIQERQHRITGTTCFCLFTYMKNKNPNWQKKFDSIFNLSNFKSQYTEYDKITEKEALKVYIEKTGNKVLQTGLIISQQNPWLGFSPDGIIFKDEKPDVLLEIKCPFKGKKKTVDAAIQEEFGKCLVFSKNGITLKKKHKYYGQVQLGMTLLNVKRAIFLIYASFDKSFRIINVQFDEKFIINMLTNLEKLYFNTLLHKICIKNDPTKENRNNDNNSEV